jgi:alpha-mannosidase
VTRHLVVVPHTHWDREWYRTHEQFRYQLVELLDGLLDLLESDPDFAYFTLDGQVVVLDDYLEVRPEARERIDALIRAGRVLIGPWYVLPDEWLVSGEALIRNLRMGQRRAEGHGGSMRLGYVPDQFGHVGQMPQIFAGFGFDAAVLWRGVGDDVDRAAFDWESPDGTAVMTVYLRGGYGNASNLPLDGETLSRRLQGEVEKQDGHGIGSALLLMNGSDHLRPQPGLPAALRAAAGSAGLSVEIGTLPGFVERLRGECDGELQLHRGELRSGLRSPLLAGCASSRIAQKRADFDNDSLLTRYLEPLAAWLQVLGGNADCRLLDFIWRVAIENHPHDSICGCSVDAVHDQMDTRFSRVRELATAHLARIQRDLGDHVEPVRVSGASSDAVSIAVWNPGAGGVSQVEGEIEFDVGDRVRQPSFIARTHTGERVPVAAQALRAGQDIADYTLPAQVVRTLVRGFPAEFMGLFVTHTRQRRPRAVAGAPALEVTLYLAESQNRHFDLDAAKDECVSLLEREGDRPVRFRARRPPLWQIRFVDSSAGCGLRSYRLETSRKADRGAVRAETHAGGGATIENESWRIDVDAGGRVDLTSLASATRIGDAVTILDEGDRGDEYTFDPVANDVTIRHCERATVRLRGCCAAEASIEVRLRMRVPRELSADRASRSARTVALPVTLTLRLAQGLDRIDVDVEVDNTARDHRLRVAFRAPFGARHFEVESALEVVERPIAPKPGDFGHESPAEFPTGATPHRTFATLIGADQALTLANRGSPEVEVIPGDGEAQLASTLVRSVGWLSRGDLSMRPMHAGPPMATPGAQSLGRLRAEFSLRLHAVGDATRAAHAHAFAHPPLAFRADGSRDDSQEKIRDGDRLLEVDDPCIAISALEPQADGSICARVVNLSHEKRAFELRWNSGKPAALTRVDLSQRPLGPGEASLAPWQIASYRVDPGG